MSRWSGGSRGFSPETHHSTATSDSMFRPVESVVGREGQEAVAVTILYFIAVAKQRRPSFRVYLLLKHLLSYALCCYAHDIAFQAQHHSLHLCAPNRHRIYIKQRAQRRNINGANNTSLSSASSEKPKSPHPKSTNSTPIRTPNRR